MIRAQRKRRTPLVLQMERAECGAACLAMVLAAHGRWITLEESRERCATSRDGVDAANLVAAARSFGLEAAACRREPETLAAMPMPLILHWCFDHFVVLEKVRGGRFTILDPARGRRVVSAREFGESFTGLAIAFSPGEEFTAGGEAPSVLRALTREALNSRDALFVSFLTGLTGVVPALAMTGATSAFVDYVLGARQSSWVPALLAVLAAVVLAKAGLTLIHKRTVATWKIKIGAISALSGFWRALTLPLAFFAQRSAGEIVARVRLGSDIGGTVAGPLADAMPQLALATGYLGILALYDPLIMLAAFAAAALNLAVLTLMARALADRTRELQVAEGRAAAAATSGMANLGAYRALGREDLLLSRWSAAEDEALDADQQLGRWRAFAALGPTASGLLLSLVALVMGSIRALDGSLTLGDLVAVQMLAGLLNSPVASFASGLTQIQESAGALMRLSDLESHPRARTYTLEQHRPAPLDGAGVLRLEAVGFGYSAGAPLLAEIDLEIARGELVAVLGRSGAGKSTLAKLAAGLIDPTAGRVTLDGIALEDYVPEELRRRLVYVSQAPAAFSASVEENVTLWDPAIDGEAVHRILGETGFAEALSRRGSGIRHKINGADADFSGGEMQRLALARALVRRPLLVVLDETTSALDPIAEEEMLALLRGAGVGALIVTHRPGTAMRCDRAIFVAEGGIAEVGRPEDVLARYQEADRTRAA
ncbi:MAG: cysteine peptidase family C39 domain-containing protein [Hyphomicrobiaceae bacterium]